MGVVRKGPQGTPSLRPPFRQVKTESLVAMPLLRAQEPWSWSEKMNALGRTLEECNLWVKWLKLGPTGLFY